MFVSLSTQVETDEPLVIELKYNKWKLLHKLKGSSNSWSVDYNDNVQGEKKKTETYPNGSWVQGLLCVQVIFLTLSATKCATTYPIA